MPINIPPLITNTGNDVSLFGTGSAPPPAGGVSTLNGLDGVLQLVANSGASGIAVVNDALTNSIKLSTAGQAQAPLSVTTAGVVSAGQITGAGFGNFLPTTQAGTGSTGVSIGTTGQYLNIVIGNTRIQGGALSVGANSGGGAITFATAFVGVPLVYPAVAADATVWVSSQSTSGCVINLPVVSPSNIIYYLAIGPA